MNPILEQALSKLKAPHDDYYMGYGLPETVPDAYDQVRRNFKLPFPLYPFQADVVNHLAHRPASGYYMDMGIGKTATSTASMLYKFLHGADQAIILVPPILITNWVRWLRLIPEVSVCAYAGVPKYRKSLSLKEDFLVMSYQIFKQDFDHLTSRLGSKKLIINADEATAIKNTATANFRAFKNFTSGHDLMLLTGTPLSTPIDGYAYIKLCAPNIYRSLRHFENIHIGERDFFGNVVKWNNLELLADNLKVNSVRILVDDVLDDLPKINYIPVYYPLDSDHYRLYVKLAEEQLLRLDDGSKIDATTATALYHALQQIIANFGHFSGNPGDISAGVELLEESIEESGKLVVFTNYRMTNRMLTERLKKYNAVFVWGEVSATEQSSAIDRFVEDKSCHAIVLQTTSGGYGIDKLQHVSRDVFFLELPTVPRTFHQACARVRRVGQREVVNVRIAIADRTCMHRMFNDLMDRDQLVNRVVRGMRDLRDSVFGG